MKKNITYKVNTKNLLALCHILDDYKVFSTKIDEISKSKEFPISDMVKIVTRNFTFNYEMVKFYNENKQIIDTILNYTYIYDFIIHKKELDDIYNYLIKHQDKLNKIIPLITKLDNLKIKTIEFDESLDFTDKIYNLDTAFNYNFEYYYLDNMEILPTYDSQQVNYKTNNSNYEIEISRNLINDIICNSIRVNSLWFDSNKLPDVITIESTFNKIVALASTVKPDQKSLKNIIDLDMAMENIQKEIANFYDKVEQMNDNKAKQELIKLLEDTKQLLNNIAKINQKYSTDIYNTNPKINEELVNKEKEKIYAKKWFSSIDID